MASIYTVAVSFSPETGLYTVIEPAGLASESASLDEIVAALPAAAHAAFNLPPGEAGGLELVVHIPPDPDAAGATGATGATGAAMSTRAARAQLNEMTKDELMAIAEREGVEVNHSWNKADIISAILAKRKASTGM